MPDLKNLNDQYRLFPWLFPEHAAFVLGHYGALLGARPSAAKEYVETYRKKELESDASYEEQRRLLRESSVKEGEKPQELLDQVKIDWNPEAKFATVNLPHEPAVPVVEAVVAPKVSKKRGRKPTK